MEKDTSTNNVFYCQNVTRSTRCIFFIEQNLIWSVDLFDLENGIEIYRQSLIKKQTLDSNVTAGTAVPQWPQYRHFLILFSIPIVRCPISLHWKNDQAYTYSWWSGPEYCIKVNHSVRFDTNHGPTRINRVFSMPRRLDTKWGST